MQQTIPALVTSILPHTTASDIAVTLTFRPGSPFGLTAVDTSTDPAGHEALLDVLFEALQRLRCYIDTYEAAWQEDTDDSAV